MSQNILDGYVNQPYLTGMYPYTFDSTGTSTANLITNEVHSSLTEPVIFPAGGPFYGTSLVITGIPNGSVSPVPLVLGVDYQFSPVFGLIYKLLNLPAYSYILILQMSNWASIKITYQAVGGVVDNYLLSQVATMSGASRLVLSNWQALLGDELLLANQDIATMLSEGSNAYVISEKLNTILAAVDAPTNLLTAIRQAFTDMQNSNAGLASNLVALKTEVDQLNANINSFGNYFPSLLGNNLHSNWYKKIPDPNSPTGYLLIQGGSIHVTDFTGGSIITPINFPITFPNKVLFINPVLELSGGYYSYVSLLGNGDNGLGTNITNSYFSAVVNESQVATQQGIFINYLAIGY